MDFLFVKWTSIVLWTILMSFLMLYIGFWFFFIWFWMNQLCFYKYNLLCVLALYIISVTFTTFIINIRPSLLNVFTIAIVIDNVGAFGDEAHAGIAIECVCGDTWPSAGSCWYTILSTCFNASCWWWSTPYVRK